MNAIETWARKQRVAKGAPWRAGALLVSFALGGACVSLDAAGPGGEAAGEKAAPGGGVDEGASPDVRLTDGTADDLLPVPCKEEECRFEWPKGEYRACPLGTCYPGGVNGPGVYVAKGGDYCLRHDEGPFLYCPEGFLSKPGGDVRLRLRDYAQPESVQEVPLGALVHDEKGERKVELIALGAIDSKLVVSYRDGGVEQSAEGAGLEPFTFTFEAAPEGGSTPFGYELSIAFNAGASTDVERYQVAYRTRGWGAEAWAGLCQGKPSSFFRGARVDGMTAEVKTSPSHTTMSCGTGAISACLDWGYRPWNDDAPPGTTAGAHTYLFATCLQAKRAAYLAGRGDPTSYTDAGTPLLRRDHFGINDEPVTQVQFEAIWTPAGALCLNEMRHPEKRTDEITQQIPRCTPIEWSMAGKFATGLVKW